MASSSAIVTAIISSLVAAVTTLAISEALRLAFSDVNERVFFPRLLRKGSELITPLPSRIFFSWLPPVLRISDAQLRDDGVSLDAMMTLMWKRLCLLLIVFTMPFDLALVLWANVSGSESLTGNLDRLTIGHLSNGSGRLWVHFFSALWKLLVAAGLLYWVGSWVHRQRSHVMRGPEAATLLVQIPAPSAASKADPSSPSVAQTVAAGFPSPHQPSSVTAVVDPAPLDKLMAKRTALSEKLEDARYAMDHPKEGKTAERPTHKTGFLGLFGPKVDSMDAWEAELKELDGRLEAARAAAVSGAPSEDVAYRPAAFASFASPAEAVEAAKNVPAGWSAKRAPNSTDVYWPNIGRLSPRARWFFGTLATTALVCTCLFFMIPIAAVSALSTLDNLERLLPFLKPILEVPIAKALLTGLLPGLALMIFLAFLPALVRKLASMGGEVVTLSGLDIAELTGLFLFSFWNVLIGNVVAGSVFSGLQNFIDHPDQCVGLRARDPFRATNRCCPSHPESRPRWEPPSRPSACCSSPLCS